MELQQDNGQWFLELAEHQCSANALGTSTVDSIVEILSTNAREAVSLPQTDYDERAP